MAALSAPSFGALLRHHRLAAGLTQEELADRAGVSPRAVSALERGERRKPYRQTIGLLAAALQLSPVEAEMFAQAAGYTSTRPARTAPAPVPVVPPLVGRSRELAAMEAYLDRPYPPVLVLAGEPGIGKSRLLQEAALQAGARGYTVLLGGAHRRSGHEPYAPLLATLSRSLQGLPSSQTRTALIGCGWLTRLLPELVEIVSAPLPTGTLPAEQERRLVFAAVARYLANIGGPAGTLLVLDDLQWASPDGLDLLASLIHAESGQAVRALAAYRDTEVDQNPPLLALLSDLAEHHLVERFPLDPLEDVDAMALLDSLLPGRGEDDGARQRIVQRTGGVPFLLVSCVHELEAGDQRDGVPWTVAQSIRQRMAVLPEAAQEALRGAAILGRVSRRSTLLHMVSAPEDEVLAGLDAAHRARLLLPQGRSAYRFAHDVVREAIEADLGDARRMLLHRNAAEALEAQPRSDWGSDGAGRAAELAWHFQEGEEPARALPYAVQAGNEAAELFAHAEARQYYRAALDIARSLGDRRSSERLVEANLLEKLSALLGPTLAADEEEVLGLLQQAAGIYRELGDRENEGRIVAQIGRAYYWRPGTSLERRRAGIAYLQSAQRSLGEDAPPQARAALSAVLAHLLFSVRKYPESLEAATSAADLARRSGDGRILAEVEVTRGAALINAGEDEAGLNATLEALHQAEEVRDHFSQIRALYHQAALLFARGSFEACRLQTERALTIARSVGHAWAIEGSLNNLGLLDFVTGDWRLARQRYEEAVAYMRSLDHFSTSAVTLGALGWLELCEGNTRAASQHLAESLHWAERSGNLSPLKFAQWVLAEWDLLEGRGGAAVARLERVLESLGGLETTASFPVLGVDPSSLLPTLAQAHLARGNGERAEELVEASVSRCRERGYQPELVRALSVKGILLAARGSMPEAWPAFLEAVSLATILPYRYAEGRALYECGLALAQTADSQGTVRGSEIKYAHQQLERANVIFRRLGARPYIERTEQALRTLVGLS